MILDLLIHFLMLSLLAVGGAISLAPEMHRYLVSEMGLLTDAQFTASIAIAQSAPGPNILFVTVLGWQAAGPWGALATTIGAVTPSAILVVMVHRFSHARADSLWVQAIKEGLAPVVIALMLATAWILAESWSNDFRVLALVVVSALGMAFTRIPPVVMIVAGALLGLFGIL
ncbi:MAG: chromate transporter [Burkholderiaceae bacterium]|nr:chromate transporter [Burkholderiaceae bacterium]